jgi:EAL domain-containing protein (putative c-di-GMP-specific phosphodiesterase class I)
MTESFLKSLMALLAENRQLDLVNRLSFEITETSQFADLTAGDRQIQRLRRLGFKVALDDLGAGAASLAYLRALKVDSVKIDGDYIRRLPDDPRNDAVLRHLVGLCRELGLTTIAEMVETEEVETRLKALGVDQAQGWYYGKAESQPRPRLASGPAAARRVGEVESWG